MGLAEIVTDRLVNKTKWEPTHINGLTSLGLASIRTPIHLPTDRECLEAIMPTVGKFEMSDVTVGWIRNTLELGNARTERKPQAGNRKESDAGDSG